MYAKTRHTREGESGRGRERGREGERREGERGQQDFVLGSFLATETPIDRSVCRLVGSKTDDYVWVSIQ